MISVGSPEHGLSAAARRPTGHGRVTVAPAFLPASVPCITPATNGGATVALPPQRRHGSGPQAVPPGRRGYGKALSAPPYSFFSGGPCGARLASEAAAAPGASAAGASAFIFPKYSGSSTPAMRARS